MADDTRNADFVGQVVSDAKNPPETRMLTGWLGESGEEGYRRLYTDAELSNYADIPDDAILYTEAIRDVQPAGGVFVWIKANAAVKQGGSAFSRAARFLQGQVQQDFASSGSGGSAASGSDAAAGAAGSLEKAGLRCATQVPCFEVTGFTGQCTNEPQVGGAWPCITAAPHCYEVTGFTGKCTHQPWPNPTRYIGCTIFHCPTQDLTHIPHICNIVATGLPGCGGINPPDKGGDPGVKTGAADTEDKEAAAPPTSIPGCGYTKTWGLCETHLLGCPQTRDCPTSSPGCGQTNDCPTSLPGCGWSKNPICTDLPGCGFTQHWGACQPTQPPKCQVSVDIPCITQDPACQPTNPARCGTDAVAAAGLLQGIPLQTRFAPLGGNCPPRTRIGPECTVLAPQCPTWNPLQCTSFTCTMIAAQCFTVPEISQDVACPSVQPPCHPIGPFGAAVPAQAANQVGAPNSQICATNIACNVTLFCPTRILVQCHPTIACPVTPFCPTRIQQVCRPVPASPFCRPFDPGPFINPQAGGGGVRFGAAAIGPQPSLGIACTVIDCGTQQPTELCTPVGCPPTKQPTCPSVVVVCPTPTQFGSDCQTNCGPDCQTQQINCTQIGDLCNTKLDPCTQYGNCNTNPFLECTHGCTVIGPQCQTVQPPMCGDTNAQLDCTFFVCPTGPQQCPSVAQPCPSVQMCPVSNQPNCPITFENVQPQAFGAPAPRPAPLTQAGCPASDFVACSQFGGCQTQPNGDCTFFGGCPTNAQVGAAGPVTVCTQSGPLCPTHQPPCTLVGPACPPTPGILCTQSGPHCPTHQFPCTIAGPACPPTPGILCTQNGPQCPTHQFLCTKVGPACPPTPGIICTQSGPLCPTHQPPCTLVGPACPPTPGIICTQFGPQCPTHQFQCTTPPACPPTPATVCTQLAPCPTHQQPCQTPGFECTMFCTHGAPGCPPQTIQGPACPVLTAGGPQCPPHSGFNCPSAIGCQSVACQSIACQPGGGGQQQQFGAAQAALGIGTLRPTPATHCFVCPPFDQFAAAGGGGGIHPTLFTQPIFQCNPSAVDACPTRLCTQQFAQCHPSVYACPTLFTQPIHHCNPSAVDACPTRLGCPTQNPQQCPPASSFNCPSQFGCPSIACVQFKGGDLGGGGVAQQVGAAQTLPAGGGPAGWTQSPIWQCFPGTQSPLMGCTAQPFPGTVPHVCTFFHCI